MSLDTEQVGLTTTDIGYTLTILLYKLQTTGGRHVHFPAAAIAKADLQKTQHA